MADVLLPPHGQFLREESIRGGMDLLFLVNTRHLQKADDMLGALGLGRAHHRVLYFVGRRPDITVSALLTILAITKQSMARTVKELVSKGLLEQRPGTSDRRQRLLRLTPAGDALERSIFDQLHDNVAQAYAAAGGEAVAGFWLVLQHLIGAEGRARFTEMQRDSSKRP